MDRVILSAPSSSSSSAVVPGPAAVAAAAVTSDVDAANKGMVTTTPVSTLSSDVGQGQQQQQLSALVQPEGTDVSLLTGEARDQLFEYPKLMVYNVPKYESKKQVEKFFAKQGLAFRKATKVSGKSWCTVVFDTEGDRDTAAGKLEGCQYKKGRLTVENKRSAMADKRRPSDQGGGGKRARREGSRDDNREQQPVDPASRTAPWHLVPYAEQLSRKNRAMENVLRRTRDLAWKESFHSRPQWLAESRKNSLLCEFRGVQPMPFHRFYRNKCEFSIGFDAEGRPSVGFNAGRLRDGVVCVGGATENVVISDRALAVCLAFDALVLQPSPLPPFNRENKSGFWRTLMVRTTSTGEAMALVSVNPQGYTAEAIAAERQRLVDCFFGSNAGSSAVQFLQQAEVHHRAIVTKADEKQSQSMPASGGRTSIIDGDVANDGSSMPSSTTTMSASASSVGHAGSQTASPTAFADMSVTQAASHVSPLSCAAPDGLLLQSLFFRSCSSVSNMSTFDDPTDLLGGSQYISETLEGLSFKISADSFFQVNTLGASVLYGLIRDWCMGIGAPAVEGAATTTGAGTASSAAESPKSQSSTTLPVVLDICCGTGTIGLCCAEGASKVVGVEMVEAAVDDARLNAEANGLAEKAVFVAGKAEQVLRSAIQKHCPPGRPIVGILDPPRAGMHSEALAAVRACDRIDHLVYVSCQQKSFVRDIPSLLKGASKKYSGIPFRPVHAIAVDMVS